MIATAILRDAPSDCAGEGWSGRLRGSDPVRGEGTINGCAWEFTGHQGGAWPISVGVRPGVSPRSALSYRVGGWDLSFGEAMTWADAWTLIARRLATWVDVRWGIR